MIKNLVLLLFLLPIQLRAQSLIEAKVLEKSSQLPIPGASIKLLKSDKYTETNANGIFVLKIDIGNADSILVSSIGFLSKKIALSEIHNKISAVIYLEENITTLNEVVIAPIKILTLLNSAILKSNANYSSPAILSGYYKEYVKRDSLLSKYADGLISFYVKKDKEGSPDVMLQVNQSRVKEIVLNDEEDKMNELNTPINIKKLADFATPRATSVLDSNNFNAYHYKLNEVTNNDKFIYVISFKPIIGSKKSLFQGKIYIDKETLLIIGVDYTVAPISEMYLTSVKILGYKISFTSKSLTARYSLANGNYNLAYIGLNYGMSLESKKYNQLNLFKSEYWVTDVQTQNCVPFTTNIYSKKTLYKRGSDFKNEFWKDYSFSENTKEETKFILENP